MQNITFYKILMQVGPVSQVMVVFQLDGKFSPLNCQLMWQNAIHPSINQASWTMEEDELLLNTAKKYDFHNWLNVAIDMKVCDIPSATLKNCHILK